MTTDQEREDYVLRRMLATKSIPHKPVKKKAARPVSKPSGELA